MRSIVAPAFSLENVRNMNDDIWAIAATFQNKLSTHIAAAGNDASGLEIDLTHWTSPASLDVIGRCGFKHDFQFGESEDAKSILHAWRDQVSAGMLTSGFVALVVLRTFPFITSLPIAAIQAQGAIKTTVRKLAQQLIDANAGQLERNTDVLSLLRACPCFLHTLAYSHSHAHACPFPSACPGTRGKEPPHVIPGAH